MAWIHESGTTEADVVRQVATTQPVQIGGGNITIDDGNIIVDSGNVVIDSGDITSTDLGLAAARAGNGI